MNVTRDTLANLDSFLKERLEADIVATVANRLGLSAKRALTLYYDSELAKKINEGKYGEQYLAPEYLAEELIKELDRGSGTAAPTPPPRDGGAA